MGSIGFIRSRYPRCCSTCTILIFQKLSCILYIVMFHEILIDPIPSSGSDPASSKDCIYLILCDKGKGRTFDRKFLVYPGTLPLEILKTLEIFRIMLNLPPAIIFWILIHIFLQPFKAMGNCICFR